MATITLPNDVILDVFKFVPYENATKLVLTSKNFVKLLQIQLKEQQIAIITEIRRLESNDLGEKQREINRTWNVLVRDKKQLCADLNTNTLNAKNNVEQNAAIDLFNRRLQAVQADMDDAYDQICAIARKRKPIIDKLENLESKLDMCGESETERFADLERRRNCYVIAIVVTALCGAIALSIALCAIIALIIGFLNDWQHLSLYSYVLLIVSLVSFVVALSLLFFILRKLVRLRLFIQGQLDSISIQLKQKASREFNKHYVK